VYFATADDGVSPLSGATGDREAKRAVRSTAWWYADMICKAGPEVNRGDVTFALRGEGSGLEGRLSPLAGCFWSTEG
jgi:hypothetical protein